MTMDRVRDLCRSAQEALLQGASGKTTEPPAGDHGPRAMALAAEAVRLAGSTLGISSYPHIQALVIQGWVASEVAGPDAALPLFGQVEALVLALEIEAPELALHILGSLAQWSVSRGETTQSHALLARITALTVQTFGEDHPRYLVLKAQGVRWLTAQGERPLGLWHF